MLRIARRGMEGLLFDDVTGGMTKSSLPMRLKRRTVPVLSAKASSVQSWLHATRRHWGFGSFGTVEDSFLKTEASCKQRKNDNTTRDWGFLIKPDEKTLCEQSLEFCGVPMMKGVRLRTHLIQLWRMARVMHLNNCLSKMHTRSHARWEGEKGGAVKKKEKGGGKRGRS